MSRGKSWTIEEEKVLISQVEKNPQNLLLAFQLASELIERTPLGCKQHYYENIIKGKTKLPKSYMYMTISKKKALPNRKVAKRDAKEEILIVKPSLWQSIKKFFKL